MTTEELQAIAIENADKLIVLLTNKLVACQHAQAELQRAAKETRQERAERETFYAKQLQDSIDAENRAEAAKVAALQQLNAAEHAQAEAERQLTAIQALCNDSSVWGESVRCRVLALLGAAHDGRREMTIPGCTCWMGRGDYGGNSIERERCTVHGLYAENAKLQAEVAALRQQVEEAQQKWHAYADVHWRQRVAADERATLLQKALSEAHDEMATERAAEGITDEAATMQVRQLSDLRAEEFDEAATGPTLIPGVTHDIDGYEWGPATSLDRRDYQGHADWLRGQIDERDEQLLALRAEVAALRQQVERLTAMNAASNNRVNELQAATGPTYDWQNTLRGLVRAAEMIEQRDGGRVWDDDVRRALDVMVYLGWGRNRIGESPIRGATGPTQEPTPSLTFQAFSEANRLRCISPEGFGHAIESWSTSDWMTAVLGELGEAANIVKKLNRYRDGVRGNTESEESLRTRLAGELADTVIYLDLVFQAVGLDMQTAVAQTWNAKSKQIGYGVELPTPSASANEPNS